MISMRPWIRVSIVAAALCAVALGSFFGARAMRRSSHASVLPSVAEDANETAGITPEPAKTDAAASATAPSPATTRDGLPVIYVTVASHSEDTFNAGTPNFQTDKASFDAQRAELLAFARMLAAHGVKYDWQSDWNFLNGVLAFDRGTTDTDGKNVVRYLSEDLGVEIDPHSHENGGYNYADVAYLIKQLGVEPSRVVGGFIAAPASSSQVAYFSALSHGLKYPDYAWSPQILWGGGTGLHQNEEDVWISGVWRPKSAEQYDTDDPSAPLVDVGHYKSDWEGLDELLALQIGGKLEAGKIYTVSLMSVQNDLRAAYTKAFGERLDAYADETASGRLFWATITETYRAWTETYGSVPSVLHWNGLTTTSEPGPMPNSEWSASSASKASGMPAKGSSGASSPNGTPRGSCGDGVCEKIERTLCPQDCS